MFSNNESYTHTQVMSRLGYQNQKSFKEWVKKVSLFHTRLPTGVWVFPGEILNDFFRNAARPHDDWHSDKDPRKGMEDE